MKDSETIDNYAAKLTGIKTKVASLGEPIEEKRLVKKFFTSLPRRFIHIVASLKQVLDLKTVGFEDVVGRLNTYEERTRDEDEPDNQRVEVKDPMHPEDMNVVAKPEDESHQKPGLISIMAIKTKRENETFQKLNAVGVRSSGTLFLSVRNETVYLNEGKVLPNKLKVDSSDKDVWYLDNAVSKHMTRNRDYFSELNDSITRRIKFGDGSCVMIKGKGSILLEGKTGEQKLLTDIYYIPDLQNNIISLGQATESGCDVRMKDDCLTMHDKTGALLMKVTRNKSRLYKIKLKVGSPVCL
ncbi:uncharacterized protein LOC143624939 [Bidens hawaiensis]|uniref:uncharacterized protein LOC143624939 n=1 Tax=Bidens hawaiensis TaxID=980011 RepID=UPI004049756F